MVRILVIEKTDEKRPRKFGKLEFCGDSPVEVFTVRCFTKEMSTRPIDTVHYLTKYFLALPTLKYLLLLRRAMTLVESTTTSLASSLSNSKIFSRSYSS